MQYSDTMARREPHLNNASVSPSPGRGGGNRRPQRLGEADQTHGGYLRAIKLFDAYQKGRDEPPMDAINEKYFEADNLQYELGLYLRWLAKTNIPKSLDRPRNGGGTPNSQQSGSPGSWSEGTGGQGHLAATTKMVYAGKIKEEIKRRFPSHPSLQPGQDAWWTALCKDFKKAAERKQNMTAEEDFGERKKYPLYRDLRETGGLVIAGGRQPDVRSILLRMMESYDRHQRTGVMEQCAQIVMTCSAIGRGGECKFNNYKDWTFDPRFQVTDIWWREMKTLNNYSMPMGPNRDDWVTDFYHAMGRYWMMEKGLLRTAADVGVGTYVFPSLHSLKDSSVTSQLTGLIRKHLPEGMSSTDRTNFSCKSMRIASQTEMAANPQVGFYESHARSGHSLGTSQESYLDRTCMALSMRAMRSLCGWKENNVVKILPRLEWLGGHNQEEAERFVEEMFPHTMPRFFCKTGTLRETYKAVGASMIMYHSVIRKETKSTKNKVYEYLRDLARKIGLRDKSVGNDWEPEMVLSEWSKIIKRNYDEANREVGLLGDGPTADRVLAMLNRMSDGVVQHGRTMSDIVSQNEELRVLNESLAERVLTLTSKLQEQSQMLDVLRSKLHCFKTPDRVVSYKVSGPTQGSVQTDIGQPRRLQMMEDSSGNELSALPPRQAKVGGDVLPFSAKDASQVEPEGLVLGVPHRDEAQDGQGVGAPTQVSHVSNRSKRKRKRKSSVDQALRHGSDADRVSQDSNATGVYNSKVTVEHLVMYYWEDKRFHDKNFDFGTFEPPPFIRDSSLKAKCRKALLLMERNTSNILKEDLCNPKILPSRLKECCHAITSGCMNDLEGLEGGGSEKSNGRKVPTIGALGNRIGKFLKTIDGVATLPPREKIPLQRIDKHFIPRGRGPRYPRSKEGQSDDRLSVTPRDGNENEDPQDLGPQDSPVEMVPDAGGQGPEPRTEQREDSSRIELTVAREGGTENGEQQELVLRSETVGPVQASVDRPDLTVNRPQAGNSSREVGVVARAVDMARRSRLGLPPETQESEWTEEGENVVLAELAARHDGRPLGEVIGEIHVQCNMKSFTQMVPENGADYNSESEDSGTGRGGTRVRRRRNRFKLPSPLEPTRMQADDTQASDDTAQIIRRVTRRNNGLPSQSQNALEAKEHHALEVNEQSALEPKTGRTFCQILDALESTQEREFEG